MDVSQGHVKRADVLSNLNETTNRVLAARGAHSSHSIRDQTNKDRS
jgi:hypothetical protein